MKNHHANKYQLLKPKVLTSLLSAALLTACGSDSNKTSVSPSTNGANSGNGANKETSAFSKAFPKSTNVFGVKIIASSKVPNTKILHAAQIMAEYLDNNEDGIPDNQAVVDELVKSKATLVMAANETELGQLSGSLPQSAMGDNIQDLQASETHLNGAANGEFDGSLEEVLHLITHVGYSKVYPSVFGESSGSALADAMDIARGGKFTQVPESYPDGAWYTYNDKTCNYDCMVTEYTYWALTSILGGQAFEGRKEDIQEEWKLNTKELVRTTDTAAYKILTDAQYALPSKLPDGDYTAKDFKITSNVKDSGGDNNAQNPATILSDANSANAGHKIAFGDLQNIYIMNPDGSNRELLADGSPISGYVAWGPTAQYVYFASAKGPTGSAWEAFRVNVRTKELTKLTNFGKDVRSLGVSPDGQYLALSIMSGNSNINGNNNNLTQFHTDLYIVEMSTAEPIWSSGKQLKLEDLRKLVGSPAAEKFWYEELNWNPQMPADGGEPVLAYTKTWRYDEDDVSYTHAYTIRADGSEQKLVLKNQDMPIWSFDGKMMCFLGMACHTIGTPGTEQLNVTGIDGEVSGGTLSPDGNFILFEVGDENRKAGIARFNTKQATPGAVIQSTNAYEPRWSPKPVM